MSKLLLSAIFVFTCLFLKAECKESEEKLIFAAAIFRHGDRTPYQPYPNDPWRDQKFWPVPFAHLTNVGKQQHYELGQWLRKRYNSLVSEKYNASEMTVTSTDVDRTIMSAQANLAGFYPPVGSDVWNDKLAWQPIPVHTIPASEDNILAGTKPCKAYDDIYDALLKTAEFKKILKDNEKLLNFLTEQTGEPIQTLQDVEYLFSILQIETIHDFQLPEWTRGVFPDQLLPLTGLSFASRTYIPTLARLKGGPLLKEILGFAKDRSKGLSNKNYIAYSAHDITIANLLNTMGLFKSFSYAPPPFAAAILFELREDSAGNFGLQMFYKNSSAEPKPLELKCGFSCSLEAMFEAYHQVIPDDLDFECMDGFKYSFEFVIAFGSILVLVLTVVTVNFLVFACKKDEPKIRLNLIPSRSSRLSRSVDKRPLTQTIISMDY